MKNIILDSGPVITLALNNLLWLLEKTKKRYKINFYITEPVKEELVDNPLTTKRFKFEALQVMNLLDKGIIELIKDKQIIEKTKEFVSLANSSFNARNRPLTLVHFPEISAISAAILHKADAVMIDERTTRYLLEKPQKLKQLMSHKLHTKVEIDKKPLLTLRNQTKNVKFIRSAEFVTIAFEKGLLDEFLPSSAGSKKVLLDALLWGLKLNGCAISTKDLETLMRAELSYKK
jgi:hypothetical protein